MSKKKLRNRVRKLEKRLEELDELVSELYVVTYGMADDEVYAGRIEGGDKWNLN